MHVRCVCVYTHEILVCTSRSSNNSSCNNNSSSSNNNANNIHGRDGDDDDDDDAYDKNYTCKLKTLQQTSARAARAAGDLQIPKRPKYLYGGGGGLAQTNSNSYYCHYVHFA